MNILNQTATQRTLRHASSETTASSEVSTVDSTGPPLVMDAIVHLKFVDPEGARRQVPGFIGMYGVII